MPIAFAPDYEAREKEQRLRALQMMIDSIMGGMAGRREQQRIDISKGEIKAGEKARGKREGIAQQFIDLAGTAPKPVQQAGLPGITEAQKLQRGEQIKARGPQVADLQTQLMGMLIGGGGDISKAVEGVSRTGAFAQDPYATAAWGGLSPQAREAAGIKLGESQIGREFKAQESKFSRDLRKDLAQQSLDQRAQFHEDDKAFSEAGLSLRERELLYRQERDAANLAIDMAKMEATGGAGGISQTAQLTALRSTLDDMMQQSTGIEKLYWKSVMEDADPNTTERLKNRMMTLRGEVAAQNEKMQNLLPTDTPSEAQMQFAQTPPVEAEATIPREKEPLKGYMQRLVGKYDRSKILELVTYWQSIGMLGAE